MSNIFDKPADFLLAEYNTLRTELLQLFSTRYQILALAFSAFSAILAVQAFGAGNAGGTYLVLLYPLLAFFLLNLYISNSRRADRIEKYIKETIEQYVRRSPVGEKFGWQTYYDDNYQRVRNQISPPFTIGGRFVFPITALVTVIAAFPGVQPNLFSLRVTFLSALFVLAILFFIAALIFAIWDLQDSSREYASTTTKSLKTPS